MAEVPIDRRGRRRDPGIDARVHHAAIDLYAEVGQTGFNFEAVARRAGVGKPALYLRWESPDKLLVSALRSAGSVRPQERGDIRLTLREYALDLIEFYLTSAGAAYLRWQVEQVYDESLGSVFETVVKDIARDARGVMGEAVVRGELSSHAFDALIPEAVHGMVFSRVTSLRPAHRHLLRQDANEFIDGVLDVVLGDVALGPELRGRSNGR